MKQTISGTANFAEKYLYYVLDKVGVCARNESYQTQNFIQLKEEEGKKYYYTNGEDSGIDSLGMERYVNYLIIDKNTQDSYTNMKINDTEQTINEIKNKEIYWNYVNETVQSNMSYINQENILYNAYFQSILGRGVDSYSINGEIVKQRFLKEYDIYTFYDENKAINAANDSFDQKAYDFMMKNRDLPVKMGTASLGFLIAITIYLFWAIGHKKGKEGITLNSIDKIPYEILSIVCFTILIMGLTILINIGNIGRLVILILAFFAYLLCYAVSAVWGVTTIKRMKAKTFFKSFLGYKMIKWLNQKIKKATKEFNQRTKDSKKLFWYYWGFVLIFFLLTISAATGLAVLVLIGFTIWVYYKLRKNLRQQEDIKNALEKIYQGDTNIYVDEEELPKLLKEMAIYVNDIAGGFSNAIEQNLKAERLKTELITNVSHDIKTPLTSIINYVDLLKKENIEDEKIKEYIGILDQKSQRLKKLTEDLVEASKVSSGNVKLNIEEIRLKELMNQCMGEFKDRLEEKNLKIETNLPEEEIKIQADNRYMYRIMENLFSNITKYAQENSRVYLDILKKEKQVTIIIKNISKEKLNITSDELMQRFVRGDKSRYTEGSGLGLSIAKSLTELQKGEFTINIDGDLFKVEMSWKMK